MTKKIAIVGKGFGLRAHLPALRALKHEVVALVTRDQVQAEQLAKENGITRGLGDWKRLLDLSELDGVILSCPPKIQYEIGRVLLDKNIPVFFEKPLATNPEQSAELLKLATTHQVPTAINFEFPESLAFQWATKMISENTLGPLKRLSYHWHVQTYASRNNIQSWKTNPDDGGGALMQFGSHALYHIEGFSGPIQTITKSTLSNTAFSLTLNAQSGAMIDLNVDTNDPGPWVHRIRFIGEHQEGILENLTHDYLNHFQWRSSGQIKSFPDFQPDGRIAAISALLDRWIKSIDHRKRMHPNVEDGHRIQCLLAEATKRSLT